MTPRILTLTPHESLAVALTMASEDWDIVHEPVAVVDLSTIAVALIDAPTTAEAEATLQDLRERGFTGPAVLSGDEPRDSGDVFVRPYDVGDLRLILRERAGLARVEEHASQSRPRREKRPKRGRRDRGSDTSFTAAKAPPPTTIPPPPLGLEPAEAAPADDLQPGGDGTPGWQRKGRLAPASAPPSAPEPDLASDEEAPAMPSPPTTQPPHQDLSVDGFVDIPIDQDVDGETAVVTPSDADHHQVPGDEASTQTAPGDDPAASEVAETDAARAATEGEPGPEETPPSPPPTTVDLTRLPPPVAPEPAPAPAAAPAPQAHSIGDPDDATEYLPRGGEQLLPGAEERDEPEHGEPDPEGAVPATPPATSAPARRRLGRGRGARPGRVARDVDAASLAVEDVYELLERVPRAADLPAVAAAIAEETADTLRAQTVAVWIRDADGYRVQGGAGLGAMEQRLRASEDHPFLGRITTNRHAVLVHPMDDIRGMLGGMAGARGATLLAAPVIRKKRVIAIVTAALDREGKQRDLDRLVAIAEESAPLVALAGQLARLASD